MNSFWNRVAGLSRRAGLLFVVLAAAALSLGAYPGSGRVLGSTRPHRQLGIVLTPRKVTLTPGSSVRLTVAIRRRHLNGPVKLTVVSKLPRGLTARFAPGRTRGKRSVLTVRAATRLRVGRYVLRVQATARRMKRITRLVVTVVKRGGTTTGTITGGGTAPGPTSNAGPVGGSGTADIGASMSISGGPAQALEPGMSQPIDLVLHNSTSSSISLSTLTAAVSQVSAPRATAVLPCTASDFSMQQYSGAFPLVVVAGATVSLQQLGVPEAEWPAISMVDSSTDQDGCQGASVSLTYGADAGQG